MTLPFQLISWLLSATPRYCMALAMLVFLSACGSDGSSTTQIQATPPGGEQKADEQTSPNEEEETEQETPVEEQPADEEEPVQPEDPSDVNEFEMSPDGVMVPIQRGQFTIYDSKDPELNFNYNYYWPDYIYPDYVAVSQPWTFNIQDDVLSFALVFEGENAGLKFIKQTIRVPIYEAQSSLAKIIAPNGDVLPLGDYVTCFEQICSMVIPNNRRGKSIPLAGTWKVHLAVAVEDPLTFNAMPSDFNVKVLSRSVEDESITADSKIYVQPHLASTLIGEKLFNNKIMPQLNEIIARAGGQNILPIEFLDVNVIENEDYAAPSYRFSDPVTSSLMKSGNKYVVNLYFVDEFTDLPIDYTGTIGISGGIPGPLGIQSSNNGVMISIGAFYDFESDTLLTKDARDVAETAIHEMGHFLGLYHTTEATGDIFDVIDDTMECYKVMYDENKDGYISVEECLGIDADNIMFFQVDPRYEHELHFSTEQLEVLRSSPIARLSPPEEDE